MSLNNNDKGAQGIAKSGTSLVNPHDATTYYPTRLTNKNHTAG